MNCCELELFLLNISDSESGESGSEFEDDEDEWMD